MWTTPARSAFRARRCWKAGRRKRRALATANPAVAAVIVADAGATAVVIVAGVAVTGADGRRGARRNLSLAVQGMEAPRYAGCFCGYGGGANGLAVIRIASVRAGLLMALLMQLPLDNCATDCVLCAFEMQE